MRCLVTGAYGFIGRDVVAALRRHGHEVVCAGRDVALGKRLEPDLEWVGCDFNRDLTAGAWRQRLAGIDVVVNAVGILQSTAADDETRIHVTAMLALATAAAEVGARFIHISAMSADDGVATGYARSKAEADRRLNEVPGDWLIIKPSLVIGRGSHGGSSLLRAAAALPFATPVAAPGTQPFQPIGLTDLADGIAALAARREPSRTTLTAAGPEIVTLRDLAARYRRWLGFAPVPIVVLPQWLLRGVAWFGDVAGYFGSPTALRSTSFEQMAAMPVADPAPYVAASGVPPRLLSQVFASMPATVQDRLHARVYFLRAALQLTLALFWIASGLIALLPGPFAAATGVLTAAGLGLETAGVLVGGGAFLDLLLGTIMLTSRGVRFAAIGQIALAVSYLALGTLLTPGLWLDPLGPLVKVVPIIVATLVLLALAEKR